MRLPPLRFSPSIPLLLFIALLLWFNTPPMAFTYTVHSPTLLDRNTNPHAAPKPITFPYLQKSLYPFRRVPRGVKLDHVFDFTITGESYQRAVLRLIPDDCVTDIIVNGASLAHLLKPNPKIVCNRTTGFGVDLGPYVKPGVNTVEVKVRETPDGAYGLNVIPQLFVSVDDYAVVMLFLLIGLAWSMVLYTLRFNRVISIASLCSLLAGLFVLYHTSLHTLTPDSWGHIPYVNYVHHLWSVPPPHKGWEFYQQPLYYFCAALFGNYSMELLQTNFLHAARHFSLFCMLAFNLYGLLFIRRAVHSPNVATLSSLVLLSWPLSIVLWGRISNEVLLFALWAPCYYYLLRWHQERQTSDLALSITLGGVMMVTKTSALVPLCTIGMVGLIELYKERITWRILIHPLILAAIAVVLIGSGYNFGRTLYYKTHDAPQMGLIVGNMYMDPQLRNIIIPNTLHNMLGFDLKTYLTNPWFRLFEDATARQIFFNSYLKSSLYGFFRWPNPTLALFVSIPLLLLVIFALIAPFVTGRDRELRLLIIAIVIAVGMQFTARLVTYSVDTNDARMTFPVMIVFVSFVGALIERLFRQKHTVLAYLGCLLLCSFFTLAYCYMLLMAEAYA